MQGKFNAMKIQVENPNLMVSGLYPDGDDVKRTTMSILYIDDDAEDIEIFGDAVKTVDPDINYMSANNGEEAMAFLRDCLTPPEHIILDINMPGMDGRSCLREIRKERKFDSVNIVVYSTDTHPNDVETIQSLGAKFMRKASSFTDLCAMIRNLATV